MSIYNTDIKFVKGIGEKRAQLFKKRLGLFSLLDLITYYPRSYENWSSPYRICDAPLNETVCIKAKISTEIEEKSTSNKKIKTYKFHIYDRTGQIRVVLFNTKYLANSLKKDEEYLFYGKIKWSGTFKEMASPEIRPISDAKIRPIYSATNGLSSRQIEKIINNAIENTVIEDFLKPDILRKFALTSRYDAIKKIHSPASFDEIELAKRRLAFDELLLLRLGLTGLKRRNRGFTAKTISTPSDEEINALFPFSLTNAQKRVVNDCLKDMGKNIPMNRLVQGDVGSGKTAVAAALCYATNKSGYNSVLLAPTELLANQHYNTLSKLFDGFNLNIKLLTGSLNLKTKNEIKQDLKKGKVDILIATHAVLTDDVELNNTALIITDEQHRFGVSQRATLSKKAEHPHTLVMSATPIPRTMGLVVYGDLDISIIDEVPIGRFPVESYAIDTKIRERALNYVKKHIDDGFQGYIICPMIESDENSELASATTYANELKNSVLKDYNIGLLHGKMKPKDKDKVMKDFANGKIQILVSTTVIEVGIDVPNAVIMVIENAERFGLSQLHQLRGRVGRGTAKSTCIFISNSTSENAIKRLETLCKTTDGFKVAEADLKLRGPGNFLGKEQHGLPKLKIADLIENHELLNASSQAAEYILKNDPNLKSTDNLLLKNEVNYLFSSAKRIEFN